MRPYYPPFLLLFLFSLQALSQNEKDLSRIGIHYFTPDFGRPHDRQLVLRQPAIKDILEYNQTRFTDPISKGMPLTKGVYARFSEFRENAPSIRDFEVKKRRLIISA